MNCLEGGICISLTTTIASSLNLSSMYSVYIPNIPVAFSDVMIAEIFNTFELGQVDRVDFLPPHEHNTRIRKVFVHFNPYNSFRMNQIVQQHANNQAMRLIVDGQGHYWDLCENKHPVPNSDLNIHQLTENMRIMQANFETKVAQLTERVAIIPQLQEEIANLQSRIKYLEDPEWLTSTGTGFQTDPLTMSMLNDAMIDDGRSDDDSDDDEYENDNAAIHPCDEETYEAAIMSSHEDEEEYDHEYDTTSNAADDLTMCTPMDIINNTDVHADASEFRAEIENHFIHERAIRAPPLMRTASLHYYVDENDDPMVPRELFMSDDEDENNEMECD